MSVRNVSRKTTMALAVGAAMLALPYLSQAQTAATVSAPTTSASDAVTVPDVTVTAERRVANLQKTPVSVGVITDDALNKTGVPLSRDLNGAVASLLAPGGWQGSTGGSIYIRGIGTSSPTYPSAVALYVDDVYIARQLGSGLYTSQADVQQLEVLRGPQGTLYGQNSSGGAIKVIAKDPIGNEGWLQGTVGNNGALGTKFYVSRELDPGLLYASIAYSRFKDDGYTYNAYTHSKVDSTNIDQFRAKVRVTPSSGLEAVLSIDGTRDHSDSPSFVALNYPGSNPRTTFENSNPSISRDSGGASLRITRKFDEHTSLKSITAYRFQHDGSSPVPSDGVPTDVFGWVINTAQRQTSQEFQLSGDYDRFTYTTGAIYFKEQFSVDRPSWTSNVFKGVNSSLDNTSYAVYGQGRYKLTDRLGLTAGVRANRDEQNYSIYGFNSNAALQHLGTTFATGNLTQNINGVTPKIGIDYQWTPDLFTYASITSGKKFGGYNPVAATLQIAQIPVQPEKVLTYEVGAKVKAFDGRVQANGALFYNDFKDYQAAISNAIINGQLINGSITVNAGKAAIYGAEFDVNTRLARGLDWSVWGTVQHAAFQSFANPTGAASSNFVGNHLPTTPNLTLGSRVNYTLPLSIPGAVRVNTTARYLGDYFNDIANQMRVTSQTYVDAGVDYTTADSKWTLSLAVKNLLDRTYKLTYYDTPSINLLSAIYNPARSVQASLRYDF